MVECIAVVVLQGEAAAFVSSFPPCGQQFIQGFPNPTTSRLQNNLKQISASGCPGTKRGKPTQRKSMLWTIFVILLVLWLLGLVSSYTMGGFIHILLVIAVVILIINLIQGRRTL
jgi:hypothetical protein